jgi:streptogramin lyase
LSALNGTRFGAAVDDVAVAPDGTVWVASETNNVILHLDGSLHTLRTVADRSGPEGIIVLSDGTLLVAEQNANRVARFNPSTGAFTAFFALTNRTANPGVDGLGIDTASGRLLVPDSPNGTLLAVPLNGGSSTVLARGLGRPVAAWAEPDGSVLVAMENAPGIVRVDTAGRVTSIGHLDDLDEVIDHNGLLYVADLRGGTLRAVDPRTGVDRVLVTGSPQPQGLALKPDGSFLLADSTRAVIATVPSCG